MLSFARLCPLVAAILMGLTAQPAIAWFGEGDPDEEFEDGLEEYGERYNDLMQRLNDSFDRLTTDSGRVVGELEGMIGAIDDMLRESSPEGDLSRRAADAIEYYEQRKSDALSDESMTDEQREEIVRRWEEQRSELDELMDGVGLRADSLEALRQDLSGRLSYAIHLEQLEESIRLHNAVRELIRMMDEAIERLEDIKPEPMS